ncbi:hypothetical protein BDZ91DRAFT_698412 [Kalaharituber pfeilii]|nr:hypothetical protein BDZ91DRAFT_698412 [Kalaharituber pfeilii]
MAPAYDEFEEKHSRRRSLSDTIRVLPRIRRNRRTIACITALCVFVIYYISATLIAVHDSPTITEPTIDDTVVAPGYQFHPILGFDDKSGVEAITIEFPALYNSLRIASAAGLRSWNQNVLFLAATVESATALAVTACEMSKAGRVQVHFGFLGDSRISAEEFQNLSGVGADSDCEISFHDGTAKGHLEVNLLKKAVKHAIFHMHPYLHPQVLVLDPKHEEHAMVKSMREAAEKIGTPVIDIPANAAENVLWMSRLSSSSLRAWNVPKMEIFIRGDEHHGNLERLLRSLQGANYYGIKPVRLTIEVGYYAPLHPFTQEFIERFNWPSRDRVTIRYPIAPPKTYPIAEAIHHVESFFPADKDTSVLFLNPNVELSPYYFHWLHYATLEYMYSTYLYNDVSSLYGISLISPKAFINGTEPFDPRLPQPSPYFYTVPSREAALYFPAHWMQFYDYFKWRIRGVLAENHLGKDRNGQNKQLENNRDPELNEELREDRDELITNPKRKRSTSARSPIERNFTIPKVNISSDFSSSWLYYFTEYATLRGAYMLYPNCGTSPDISSLAIVHSERPSHTHLTSGHTLNVGQNEQKLIQSNTLLDEIPGWKLSSWLVHPIRNVAGEEVDENTLDTDATNYKAQISHYCPEEESDDLQSVKELLCNTL